MKKNKHDICPVEKAGGLDNRLRRIFQNPAKILSPHIKNGMTLLDVGCGPGFFTIDMANLTGETGHVYAADIQEVMLDILRNKIVNIEIRNRITPINYAELRHVKGVQADFALAFYMVHEVKNKPEFFGDILGLLKDNGRLLIVEPPFHVSTQDFKNTVSIAEEAGFEMESQPKITLSKSALLRKKLY